MTSTEMRELLELAAKAAGMRPFKAWGTCFTDGTGLPPKADWNPLADDGDAFRLMVAIRAGVEVHRYDVQARAFGREWLFVEVADAGGDPRAATRLAILRAAAEVGRGMGNVQDERAAR